jgi:hypothetical protein
MQTIHINLALYIKTTHIHTFLVVVLNYNKCIHIILFFHEQNRNNNNNK